MAAPPPSTRHLTETTKEGFDLIATLEGAQPTASSSSPSAAAYSLSLELFTPPPTARRTLLVVLADQSSSMRPAWHQVQSALQYIVAEAASIPDCPLIVEVLLYQTTAKRMPNTSHPALFDEAIMKENASGATCFASAFDLCLGVVREHVNRAAATVPATALDVCIEFLTDGGHSTKRNALQSYTMLQTYLHSLETSNVVVHTIGFTPTHLFSVLDKIRRELGKSEGTYSYADLSDGRLALRRKMEGVFDVASMFGGRFIAEVTVSPASFAVISSNIKETDKSTAVETVVVDRQGKATLSFKLAPLPTATAEEIAPSEKMFVAVNCTLRTAESGATIVELATQATVKLVTGEAADLLVTMRTITDLVDAAQDEIFALKQAPPPDVCVALNRRLEDIKERLKAVEDRRLFALPRVNRTRMLEIKGSLHVRVAQLLDVMAHYARGVFSSATQARLAELAYGGSFKANRQRRVDSRVARNAILLKDDTTKLAQLVAPTAEQLGASVSEESKSMFSCIMSLENWTELAAAKDICGFGIAASRPDWVVDDPTQMRILVISNTCISKSAIEDVLRSSIELHGQTGTTGGFGIGTEMGVAMRGAGREPINSWLPLYISPTHWAPARILLKQILGYFVVLDPLAFAQDQPEALFLVLGTMAARLSKECGQHTLRLMLQFQRTCLEITREFNLFGMMEEKLKRFITMSPYETRDGVKNLVSFVSYLFLLPLDAIDRVFPSGKEWVRFWCNVIAIAIRRSAFTVFGSDRDPEIINGFLDKVLYGNTHHHKTATATTAPLNPAEFLGMLCAPLISADDSTGEVSWDDCIQSTPADNETEADPYLLQPGSPEAIIKFLRQMERRGYPTIQALASLLTYSTNWIDYYRQTATATKTTPQQTPIEVLDENWGVAPDAMIAATKAAFSNQPASSLGNLFLQVIQGQESVFPVDFVCDLIRSVVAMGVKYRVNKPARDALDCGMFMDPAMDPLRALEQTIHVELWADRQKVLRGIQHSRVMVAEAAMAMTGSEVHSFLTWVSKTCGAHRFSGAGFKRVINSVALHAPVDHRGDGTSLDRTFVTKLWALFSGFVIEKNKEGQYEITAIFPRNEAKGNRELWIPGRAIAHRLGFSHAIAALIHAMAESYYIETNLLPSPDASQ